MTAKAITAITATTATAAKPPSEPEPSEPEPSEPKPSEPEPSESKPSEPEPSEPEPSEQSRASQSQASQTNQRGHPQREQRANVQFALRPRRKSRGVSEFSELINSKFQLDVASYQLIDHCTAPAPSVAGWYFLSHLHHAYARVTLYIITYLIHVIVRSRLILPLCGLEEWSLTTYLDMSICLCVCISVFLHDSSINRKSNLPEHHIISTTLGLIPQSQRHNVKLSTSVPMFMSAPNTLHHTHNFASSWWL